MWHIFMVAYVEKTIQSQISCNISSRYLEPFGNKFLYSICILISHYRITE